MKNTIQLIASGYEWICPECEHLNHEIEIVEVVKCQNCGEKYLVDEALHTA